MYEVSDISKIKHPINLKNAIEPLKYKKKCSKSDNILVFKNTSEYISVLFFFNQNPIYLNKFVNFYRYS